MLAYREFKRPLIFLDFSDKFFNVYRPRADANGLFPLPSYALDTPAARPDVTVMHITTDLIPWGCKITNPRYITVGDVLEALHRMLSVVVSAAEWDETPAGMRWKVEGAYQWRKGRSRDASTSIKRVDYLLGKTQFGGLAPTDSDYVWELVLVHPPA